MVFEAQLPPGATGGFYYELTEEFLRAFANAAKLTLHVSCRDGYERAPHDRGVPLRRSRGRCEEAVSIDPTERGVPSTKGTLTA